MKLFKIVFVLILIALAGLIVFLLDFGTTKSAFRKFDSKETLFYKGLEYFENIPKIRDKIEFFIRHDTVGSLKSFTERGLFYDSLLLRIYTSRDFLPIWGNAELSQAMTDILSESDKEGLNPDYYHLQWLKKLRLQQKNSKTIIPEEHALFDIFLTDAAICYAFHLASGKANPQKIMPSWNILPRSFGADSVKFLQRYSVDSLRKAFSELPPKNASYIALRKKLAEYSRMSEWDTLPKELPSIALNEKNAVVPLLKKRLRAERYLSDTLLDTRYDTALRAAVKRFQAEHDLPQTGFPDKLTLKSLNVSLKERTEQIKANMERLRWTGNFPPDRLTVNIAAFRLYLYRADTLEWTTRVIIGKPYTSTPVFTAPMTNIVFNPTWTVPTSIIQKEILKELRRDAVGYLQNQQMDIINMNGEKVAPESIDWTKTGKGFPYLLRQRSGSQNSLGTIKFNLPNPHAVYLHDTPNKRLFNRTERAFSHGCVRVENPYLLAEKILADTANYGVQKIEEIVQKRTTRQVNLKNPIPVFILYETAGLEPDGRFIFRQDFYGRDKDIIEILSK